MRVGEFDSKDREGVLVGERAEHGQVTASNRIVGNNFVVENSDAQVGGPWGCGDAAGITVTNISFIFSVSIISSTQVCLLILFFPFLLCP